LRLLKLTVLGSEFQTFIMRSQKNNERAGVLYWWPLNMQCRPTQHSCFSNQHLCG